MYLNFGSLVTHNCQLETITSMTKAFAVNRVDYYFSHLCDEWLIENNCILPLRHTIGCKNQCKLRCFANVNIPNA
ncbi:30S ribosomal protein S18 [Frankliniella fusca]|uniref:30S ribosomal protein S18 n=1 Tax=Frankliniella fusca TaxID=407009 RepID=A0AAE1LKC5_9NEOP|nr:30S ribosomal protein S18 [Frankliniella fusca]